MALSAKELQAKLDEMEARAAEAEAKANAAEARATAAEAKSARTGTLTLKVSEKGGISLYGLQRMPVTLYVNQWEKLIAHVPTLQAFMAANTASLSRKVAPVASVAPTEPKAE